MKITKVIDYIKEIDLSSLSDEIALFIFIFGFILILIGYVVGINIVVRKEDMEQVWEYIHCGRIISPYKTKNIPNGTLIIIGAILIFVSLFII